MVSCWSQSDISYLRFYLIYVWGNIFRGLFATNLRQIWDLMGNWNKLTRPWNRRVCILQFPIDTKIPHKWLEKCYPEDKFNKSTRRICLIYFTMVPLKMTINFGYETWILYNDLMLVSFHISLKKWFFPSFDRHSDNTVALNELLPKINKFRKKKWIFS